MTKTVALVLARFAAVAFAGVAVAGVARASEPFVVIVQYPDYPLPSQPSRYPGGLVFAACSSGLVLRAKSLSDVGSNLYAATLSMRQIDELKSVISPALRDKLRADCRVTPLHSPSHGITVRLGDETDSFLCYLGVESKAVDALNAAVWNMPMSDAHFVGQRPEPLCQ